MTLALELAPMRQPMLSPEVLAELELLVNEVELLIESSWAESTRSRYTRQWERFESWCEERKIDVVLPIPVELVQLYLAHWVTRTPAPAWSTIAQAHAAIRWVHRANDVAPPDSVKLQRQLSGIRRKLGVAPRRQAAPLRLNQLRKIVDHYSRPSRANLRDAVVIALRFADWTYGEIVGMTIDRLVDVSPTTVTVRMTDGEVRTYSGEHHPIVTSLNAWLQVRGGFPGAVVVRVDTLDAIAFRPIPRQTVAHIVSRWSGIASDGGTADHQAILDAVMQPRPADVRDLAVLFLIWAGALRSDELVRLRLRDLAFDDQGLTVQIRWSKTDQKGKGETKVIPRPTDGTGIDIVAIVHRWVTLLREAGAADSTPVFVGIDRHDNLILTSASTDGVEAVAPSCLPRAVTDIVRRALVRAVPDIVASHYSSHSGKRGIATELAHAGADVREIMSVTGHKRAETAMRYIDEVDRWTSSALNRLKL